MTTRARHSYDGSVTGVESLPAWGQVTGIWASGTTSLYAAPQTEVITMTGSGGTANVPINGVNYLMEFDSSLSTTIDNFITTYAAILAALVLFPVEITRIGNALVVKSKEAGVVHTSGNAVNATGNLAGTAAVSSQNSVIQNSISRGDFIYFHEEIRRVLHVYPTHQRVDIESAFSSPVAGENIYRIKAKTYKRVYIENVHATVAGKVNGQTLAAGKHVELRSDFGVDPVLLDGTGSTLTYIVEY